MNARTGHDPGVFIRKVIHISITDHFRDKISIRLKQDRIVKCHFTGKRSKALPREPLRRNYDDFTVNLRIVTLFQRASSVM